MRVTLPVAMNISMAEKALQEFSSSNGISVQKSDGLPSPERSGSPELKARSSQWKRDRLAYASKEDAHQIDDWPEAHNKSQDVLVRYKDTRRSKGLSTRMDPHAWSDLPTDTDDEVAETATSPAWNSAHDVLSPKSATGSKTGVSMQQIQQPKTIIPRNPGGVRTEAEVKIQYLASEDRCTVALDGGPRQEADTKSDVEKERGVTYTKLPVPVATGQDGSKSPSRAVEAEKAREGNDAGPGRVPTLKNVPGRFSYMKSPPRAPSQKGALDEQATMKMSHRYYTNGLDSNRRRSMSNRVAVKDAESGKEDKHRSRRRKEMVPQADYKARTHRAATSDVKSSKELDERLSTTLDSASESDCSDVECKERTAVCEEEDAEESFRQMILQKYLVMLPGKSKKMQSTRPRASTDTKHKNGRCKSPATSMTKAWAGTSDHRYFTGKNLHPISPSRSPSRVHSHVPKKKPCPPEAVRQTVSQPAAALLREQASPKEPIVAGKNSLLLLLRKSWSMGDVPHSKSLGDICTLNGHPLTDREMVDMENSLTEQEKRSIEFQMRSATNPKASMSEAPQTGKSSCAVEKIKTRPQDEICPPLPSEGHEGFANLGIRSVEVSTVTVADLPLTKVSEEEKAVSEFRCDCFPPSVLSNAQLNEHSGALEGAELQWQGRVAGQGLSALALFPGTTENPEKSLEMNTNDTAVLPLVEGPSVDGSGGGRIEERQVKLHGKGAKASSNGGSNHGAAGKQVKHGNGVEESRNGFSKQKIRIIKVTAVVPFDSCESDQVLPDVSLAGQPALHTLLGLQYEVESKQCIADERRQRASKQRSTEQRCGTEVLAQQRRGFWDSSQELQREKQTLLKRLQELEVHHPCNRLKAMSGTKVQLTEEDAKKLRQEILEQEALIRGYQVENEKAVAKLKEVQLETRQKLQEMAEEKAHLASQLANRHMQSYGTDWHEKLQGGLSRENALRIDLDKMRDSYAELEKRVQREESSRMKDLELKLTTLHETLEAERQSHAQMEGRKQAMIQQEELIASLQETISDQASKIRELTMRLEGDGEGQGKMTPRLDQNEAQQQIETLQSQVKRLDTSLRAAKKETGLHALQVAKSGMEENETIRRMQTELVAVQRHAQQREEETNRIIHHLKVENDKIKHESATRIRNLKQQIQTRAQSGHSISESELSALNRVKDLEKQVANLRIHYSRKVKELSDKLEEASKPEVLGRNKSSTDSMAPPARVVTTRLIQPAQGKALREAKERITLQEDVLSQKDRTIRSLQTQLQEMESKAAGPNCTTAGVPSIEGEKHAETGAQEVHCSSTPRQESVHLRNSGTCSHTGTNTIPNDINTADEVAVLRRELEKSELTREVLQKACSESVEKAVLVTLQHQQVLQNQQIRQSQMKHHRISECQAALAGSHASTFTGWGDHRSGLEGMNWLSERSSSEMANRAMEARLKVMSEELEEANNLCQQSPRMQQIMTLKKKVAELEARQQQKEMEWQKILQETKQTSSIEQEYAERKWREALNSKSIEVEKIRLELNAIIEAAMAMRQAQLQMNQKT